MRISDWSSDVCSSDLFGQLQRGLETVGKPGLYAVAADEAVHHHLGIVLQLLVERGSLVDLEELAVDADALEARFPPFGQFLAVFALAAAHHWRKQIEPRPIGQRHQTGHAPWRA